MVNPATPVVCLMFASHRCPRFPWPRSLAGGVPAKPRPSRRSADALVRARCRCCGKCPGSANCGLTVRCLGAVWEKFCDRHGGLADESVRAPLNCLVPAYAVRASSAWPNSPGRCGGRSPDALPQDGQRADLWLATRTKTGFGGVPNPPRSKSATEPAAPKGRGWTSPQVAPLPPRFLRRRRGNESPVFGENQRGLTLARTKSAVLERTANQ